MTTNPPYRTACVTGGAGFIGSHLVRALLERGVAVRVLDNLSVGKAANVPAGATLIVGDVVNGADVAAAVAGCDVVFHLAARVAIRASFEGVAEDATCNVVGTATVLRAAQLSGTVRKFVLASSMAVYADGSAPTPVAEGHPTRPISPYGISKLAAEQLTHCVCAATAMQSIVLRLFNTYGPGQALSPYVGVVTIFVNQLHAGQQPTIYGDGTQCRDFVHVEDVVSGFVSAMEADVSGATFNIGTGVATSVNAVYDRVRLAMHASVEPRHAPPVAGELKYSVADITTARTVLGYAPTRTFGGAIAGVVAEILAGRQTAGVC